MEAVKKESKVSQLWNKAKTKIISILKNKSSLFYYVLILIGFGIVADNNGGRITNSFSSLYILTYPNISIF